MIPDDIRKAADTVAGSCPDDHYYDGIRDAAVRALMNERERCAKIAEGMLYDNGCCAGSAEEIAAAIRRGDNPDA